MEKIVIFGGTFDPVHNGHLRIARSASLLLNADVVFVPAKDPRWKTPEASPVDRLAMLKNALEEDGSGNFSIDLSELARPGNVSYSIDTVREFHNKYKNRDLYWLIGADEVNKFKSWKDPDELASLCHIVFIPRPEVKVNPEMVTHYHMMPLEYSGSGSVSSSSVRNLQNIDVPPSVLSYIEEHNLYFMKKVSQYMSPKRLAHSLSVAHLAYAIAKKNDVISPEKAYVAGLLHDIGKDTPEKESRAIIAAKYPAYKDYPSWCLHQFVGAYLAEKDFGIEDENILDAILFHCTGKAHMPPLSKIIYSADKIDPSRGFDSSKMIDKCFDNYYMGFLYVLRENELYLAKEGQLETTPLSESCHNLYIGERKKR